MSESFEQSVLRKYEDFIKLNETLLRQLTDGELKSSNPDARRRELELSISELRHIRARLEKSHSEG